jgi:hypothetical protein
VRENRRKGYKRKNDEGSRNTEKSKKMNKRTDRKKERQSI